MFDTDKNFNLLIISMHDVDPGSSTRVLLRFNFKA